jgi:predicted unusual protein kinase regulating ubiquinone biosynthesis (AarF/ABC1/UbiB family)
MTIEWIDGIKISDVAALKAAGARPAAARSRLVLAVPAPGDQRRVLPRRHAPGEPARAPDGTIVAIDFGIMGRIDRARGNGWPEILYGLTTGNYRRVAEIHFEAQYVPSYHSVDEFATALRAVGEPMRGKPVSDCRSGLMLDGLFAITRDFDMQTQPHLLLLQKTMVMVEGIATMLHPEINMWDVSRPSCAAGSATSSAPKPRWPTASARTRHAAAPARPDPPHRGSLSPARRRARAAAAARDRAGAGTYRAIALARLHRRRDRGRRGSVARRPHRVARLTVLGKNLTIARQGPRQLAQGWPYGGSKARLAS